MWIVKDAIFLFMVAHLIAAIVKRDARTVVVICFQPSRFAMRVAAITAHDCSI